MGRRGGDIRHGIRRQDAAAGHCQFGAEAAKRRDDAITVVRRPGAVEVELRSAELGDGPGSAVRKNALDRALYQARSSDSPTVRTSKTTSGPYWQSARPARNIGCAREAKGV